MWVLRVLLDSNAFDSIALDDERMALVQSAVERGALELVVTHVQVDEVSCTPDAAKRRALLRLSSEVNTPTAGAAWDKSRWDLATFTSAEDAAIYRAVTAGNPRHAEDALLLLTARREGVPLVTNEDRLSKQCALHGVTAWTPADLIHALTAEAGGAVV